MSMTDAVRHTPFGGRLMTVCGPVGPKRFDVVDAHNHIWIDRVMGIAPNAPQLTEYQSIAAELRDYCEAGGKAIVDCQPGGCGRDGRRLLELSQETGVEIIACTGFHRAIYYPAGWWLWEASVQEVTQYFIDEIRHGLQETRMLPDPARAGLLKCACEASLRDTPRVPLEAAAWAAAELGVCVEIHTEKGADAESVIDFFMQRGVAAAQLVLCHMDKRADFQLHCSLARAGVMLEYDTFFRPKYAPETHVWPLIEKMVSAGFERSIALATDMAETSMWWRLAGGPGLVSFLTRVRPRLEEMGMSMEAIRELMGGNIANRLAGVA